jgi:hypothetical protein
MTNLLFGDHMTVNWRKIFDWTIEEIREPYLDYKTLNGHPINYADWVVCVKYKYHGWEIQHFGFCTSKSTTHFPIYTSGEDNIQHAQKMKRKAYAYHEKMLRKKEKQERRG